MWNKCMQFISGYMWFHLKYPPEDFIASRFCNWTFQFHFKFKYHQVWFWQQTSRCANIIEVPKLRSNQTVILQFNIGTQSFTHFLCLLPIIRILQTYQDQSFATNCNWKHFLQNKIKILNLFPVYFHELYVSCWQSKHAAVIKAICFSSNIHLIKKWCQLISFDTPWLEKIRVNPKIWINSLMVEKIW